MLLGLGRIGGRGLVVGSRLVFFEEFQKHLQTEMICFVSRRLRETREIQILESLAIMYGEMKEYLYVPSLKEVG